MSLLLELIRAVREIYECSTKNTATSNWLIHDIGLSNFQIKYI